MVALSGKPPRVGLAQCPQTREAGRSWQDLGGPNPNNSEGPGAAYGANVCITPSQPGRAQAQMLFRVMMLQVLDGPLGGRGSAEGLEVSCESFPCGHRGKAPRLHSRPHATDAASTPSSQLAIRGSYQLLLV